MDTKAAQGSARPVAVVGMAGRFPGATDVDGFWRLMTNGGDGIRPVPKDRWDSAAPLDPEREIQAVGGFLDGVDLFDAGFFGISPREAADIDPQQRLMLEESWRALEDAGQRTAALAGSRTGVYVGASWHDYELLRHTRGERTSQHSLVGNALDVIAARVSYFLGLTGPSLTVETGCSSALVALHLAAQALHAGEIDGAIVGGANLILTPDVSVGLTYFGGLSPDGRCAAFGAGANGFVRGEGVAALYVKTLERALADGDRIHGVITRTVVNNDGGGDGLITPSPAGQRQLLRLAYGEGGVPPDALAYLEAHGTGTGRGDPVEAAAIGSVLGRARTVGPLPIGSVKTNIGHLEAAAGLAGLIKVLLALRHRIVPPSLHASTLNPEIAFADLNLTVVREPLVLPATGPLHVGVNSFGWGGTNAHVVVAAPPQPDAGPEAGPVELPALVTLSAKHRPVLAERAAQLRALADDPELAVAPLAGALAWRRDHFPFRAAVLAAGAGELRAGLDAVATAGTEDLATPGAVAGRAVPHGRTAFVFPGQGSQWSGMGRDLYRDNTVFADAIRRCADALRPWMSWDPLAVFTGAAGDTWMSRIDMLQPVLWAMSLGLAELWRGNGIVPDVVLGHSQGEIAAATFAGILSYRDGAQVVARRSAIARRASGRGLMLAVDLDRDEALAALAGFEDAISFAVHNGPRSCVLSGDYEAVLMLKELLEAEGTYCRLVNVDYASHSHHMEALREDLLAALGSVAPRAGRVDLFSTTRVDWLDGGQLDARYWVENLRRPVQFADAMAQVFASGVTHVIEISPHPVLVPAIEQLAADHAGPPVVLATLRRDAGTPADLAVALGRAYVSGLEPFGALPRAHLPLPGYPLRRDRYWPGERVRRGIGSRGLDVTLAPAPTEPDTWYGALDLAVADLPWLADHTVHRETVLPGTAMLALAVNTARARTGEGPRELHDVTFGSALAFGDVPLRLTAEWREDVPEGGSFRLLSLADGGGAWAPSASARASFRAGTDPRPTFPAWPAGQQPESTEQFYAACAARGLGYGPAFQCVRALYRHPGGQEALGEVVLGTRLRAGSQRHVPHPALWDGALQVCLALLPGEEARVPVEVRLIRLLREPAQPVTTVWSHAVHRGGGEIDVFVFDADHDVLFTVEGLRLRALSGGDGREAVERRYRLCFVDGEAPEVVVPAGRWVVAGEAGKLADQLAEALAAAGADVVLATGEGTDPLGGATQVDGVVFTAATAGLTAQRDGLVALAATVRAAGGLAVPPRFAVVTACAQPAVPKDSPDPGAALFWGFTRVLRREHTELEARLIDVDPSDPDWAAGCAAEVCGEGGEDQVALRRGRRLVARLARGATDGEAGTDLPPRRTVPQPFRVGTARPGFWEDVTCLPLDRRAPGPGEMEVEVTASALNFIDVMKVLGTYPDESTGADLLGGECAGRVVAVGPGVAGFVPGDRVIACAFGGLASHLTVRADHARPVPAWLSDVDAAALPLVTATAWYSLVDLARLERDETVLVHSAAGGVGLAAVAVARSLGARVVATAGTAAKRAHLESLGVDAVFDSRDLSWVAGVRVATAGRGIDVVLNSLAGAAIPHGLDLLAEDGRFVEIGKKDIYAGRSVGLAPFRKGISLVAVDLAGLMERRPRRFAKLLADAWQQITDHAVAPLPVRTHPFAEVGGALREMSQGRHIGKFVVADPATAERVAPQPMPGGRFRAEGTYLISGGLGALGLSLAEFLAEHGAGALLLLGRSAPAPAVAGRLDALRQRGVRVVTARCDVADAAAVRAAVDGARPGLPPLRGVVHAAGVVADATVGTMTAEQLDQVLGPKIHGVRSLEAATAGDPLDFFMLFSSVAALVGNPGQAAYAAANAYLDAFAQARRGRGWPALSVQWGPFAGIGLASADERRGDRLGARGMGGFRAGEAWRALVRMLADDEPVLGYVPLDLRQWFDANPETAALPSWEWLRAAARDGAGHSRSGGEFLTRLHQADGPARAGLVEAKVRELAGRVLRLDPERVERETPFKELGLDSLLGLELRNRLESAFGLRLSPTLLWTYSNSRALAGALCERLPAPGIRSSMQVEGEEPAHG
jgi:phthiocerol/phenolphthiocerol synthesis type-I polyketide synthase C